MTTLALAVMAVFLIGCGTGAGQEATAGGGQGVEKTRRKSVRSEDLRQEAAGQEPAQNSEKRHAPAKKLRLFNMTLEGYPDAENVGVLIADQRGYFAEAGFDVNVLAPIDSDNVAGYLATGSDVFGLLPLPQVVISREKQMPLVAIGSLTRRSAMAMIWPRESGIGGLADLKGKTVAINGLSYEEGFLEAVLDEAGLSPFDVQVKSVSYGLVSALSKGRVDAILGSANVQGVELEALGLDPVVTPLRELGVPPYEQLVMTTRRNRLAGKSRWVHRFMSAVARGTAAAIENPEAAAAAIVVARQELALPAPSPKLAEAKVKATLPSLARTAVMSPGRVTGLTEWMQEEELIRRAPSTAWFTNRYVQPGS
ncbi:MAG TPA: ABC transporter substrate-binding protein [Solirubrobacterales bacterium]|nr:ABC transporter substrate-binding protein [Solirubrobacterales bacterium]